MVFGVSVFGVLRPYSSVENNQDITVDAKCHCPLLQAHLIAELSSIRHSEMYGAVTHMANQNVGFLRGTYYDHLNL